MAAYDREGLAGRFPVYLARIVETVRKGRRAHFDLARHIRDG